MPFNPFPDDDLDRFGRRKGEGQLSQGSPYLDRARTNPDPLAMFHRTATQPGLNKNLLAALYAGQGLNTPLTRESILDTYQRGFNRNEVGEDEIQAHLRNPGGFQGFLETIRDSEENRNQPLNQSPLSPTPNMGGPIVAGPVTGLGPPTAQAPPSDINMGGTRRVGLRGTEDLGRLRGYDHNNFNNPDVNTLKYRAGRIFSRYAPTIEGIRQAMADQDWTSDAGLSRAVWDGRDRINFQGELSEGDGTGIGVNDVDVLEALEANGQARGWAWQDQNPALAGGGSAGPSPSPNTSGLMSGGNSAIQRALMGSGGDIGSLANPTIDIDRILRALMGDTSAGIDVSYLFGRR